MKFEPSLGKSQNLADEKIRQILTGIRTGPYFFDLRPIFGLFGQTLEFLAQCLVEFGLVLTQFCSIVYSICALARYNVMHVLHF